MEQIILTNKPKIGEFVEGYTVTEVRGKRVKGMTGEVKYTPEPITNGFQFIPGRFFAVIKEKK